MTKRTQVFIPAAAILLAVIASPWALAAPAESLPARRVAVLEFQSASGTVSGSSAGIADLLEIRLHDAGVATVERRVIQCILAERRLTSAGLTAVSSALVKPLPGVSILVSGSMTGDANDQFELDATLTTTDGHELAVLTEKGRGPDGLPAAIDRLAARIASTSQVDRSSSPQAAEAAGFTRSPEAALLFYRGLAHLLAGRVDLGVACFHFAYRLDPGGFEMARVWEMRGMIAAGMPAIARRMKEDLETTSVGRQALASVGRQHGREKIWVLTSAEGVTTAFLDAFHAQLDGAPSMLLMSAESLGASTRERDLLATGQFDAVPPTGAWALADAILSFRRAGDKVHVTLRGVETGSVLAEIESPLTPDGASGAAAAQSLLAATAVAPTRPAFVADDAPPGPRVISDSWPERGAPVVSGTTLPLRRLFDESPNSPLGGLAALLARARTEQDTVASIYELSTTTPYDPQLCAGALDTLIARIDAHRDIPDAPYWLHTALIERFESVFHAGNVSPELRFKRETPNAERMAPLLAWFPNSTSALLARYAIAHEDADAGRHEQAARTFEEVLREMAKRKMPDGRAILTPWYEVGIRYFLARELYRLGRFDEARASVQRCNELAAPMRIEFSPKFSLAIAPPSGGKPWRLLSYWHYSHRQFLEQHLNDWTNVAPELGGLTERLRDPGLKENTPPPDYETARDFFHRATSATGDEAFDLHLRSLREASLEQGDHLVFPKRLSLQVAWLRLNARTDAQRQEIDALVSKFLVRAGVMVVLRQQIALMMAAGRIDEATKLLGADFLSPRPSVRIRAIFFQSEIESFTDCRRRQGEWILEEIERFDRDFPKERASSSIAHAGLLDRLAPALRMCGRWSECESLLAAVDKDRLPPAARLTLEVERALAMAGTDRAFEATEILRGVIEECHRHLWDNAWIKDLPSEQNIAYFWLGSPFGGTPEDIGAWAANCLEGVRLYGGYAHFFESPPSDEPANSPTAATKLYALASLLVQEEPFYNRWRGGTYWANEGARTLVDSADAQQLAHGLFSTRLLTPEMVWTREHQCVAMLMLPNICDRPQDEMSSARRLMYQSESCGIRSAATQFIGLQGPVAADLAPLLDIGYGDPCCQSISRWAIRAVGEPPPSRWGDTIALLAHPDATVRAAAIQCASRFSETPVPEDDPVAAATILRRWWQRRDSQSPAPAIAAAASVISFKVEQIFGGHRGTIHEAFHPLNGTLGDDRTLRIWDFATGQQKLSIDLGPVPICCWHDPPNRSRFICVTDDGTVVVWETRTGQELHRLKLPRVPYRILLNRDDKSAIAVEGDRLVFHDLTTGKTVRQFQTGATIVACDVSDDGSQLLTVGRDGSVRVWSADDGRRLVDVPSPGQVPRSACFSGGQILTWGWNSSITLRAADGRLLQVFGDRDLQVKSVALSPNGARLLSVHGDRTACLWDVASGGAIHQLPPLPGDPVRVWFDSDSSGTVVCGNGELISWDLDKGAISHTLDLATHAAGLRSLATSRDGKLAITAGTDAVIWSVHSGAAKGMLRGHYGPVLAAAFAQAHCILTTGWDGTLRAWDGDQCKQLWSLQASTCEVTALAVSPDGALAATGDGGLSGHGGRVVLWNLKDRNKVRSVDTASGVTALAFSPDGRLLAWGNDDGSVCTIEPGNPRATSVPLGSAGHPDKVNSLAWRNNAIVVAAYESGAVIQWNTSGAEPSRQVLTLPTAALSVAFSSDYNHMLVGCRDGLLRLCDTRTGRHAAASVSFGNGVWGVASLAPDRWIVASFDDDVRVLDVAIPSP